MRLAAAALWGVLCMSCICYVEAQQITCDRSGVSLRPTMTVVNTTGGWQGDAESRGSALRPRDLEAVSATTSVWAYIGDNVQCNITSSAAQPISAMLCLSQPYTLQKRVLHTHGGDPYLKGATVATALGDVAEPTQELTLLLGRESSNEAVILSVGQCVNMRMPAVFYIAYPREKLGGESQANRSRWELAFDATVTSRGSTPGSDVTETLASQAVDIQYFFGLPNRVELYCPPQAAAVQAWSSTLRLAGFEAGPSLSSEAELKGASLAFCQLRSYDSLGNAVLPDPFFSNHFGEPMLNITIKQSYCISHRSLSRVVVPELEAFYARTPTASAVGVGSLNQQDTGSPESRCAGLFGKGRLPVSTAQAAPGAQPATPTVEFFSNRLRGGGVAGGFEAISQIVLEPFDYGRLDVVVQYKDARGETLEAQRQMDIGGAVTQVDITCEGAGDTAVVIIDPANPAPQVCDVVPRMVTSASLSLAFRTVAVATFLKSFVIRPRDTADVQYLAIESVVKEQVPSTVAGWRGVDSPGFKFEFSIRPGAQPADFDSKEVTLDFYWNRSLPLDAGSVWLGDPASLGYPSELRLVGSKSLLVAFKPVPKLRFFCNTLPCDAGGSPGHVSVVDGVVEQLTVTAVANGTGVHSVHFHEVAPNHCWFYGDVYADASQCLGAGGDVGLSASRESVKLGWSAGSVPPAALLARVSESGNPLALLSLRSTFTYHLNTSTSFTTQESVTTTASVLIEVNGFAKPDGRTQTAMRQLNGSGTALVFCEDFSDADKPLRAWVEAEVLPKGAARPASAVRTGAESLFIASDVNDDFEEVGSGSAAQITELVFSSSRLGSRRIVTLANVEVVQTRHDSPWHGCEAWNVADGSTDTEWVDYAKRPISITLAEPEDIDAFTMATGSDSPENDVTQWLLEGSLNLGYWVPLHRQSEPFLVPVARRHTLGWFDLQQWRAVGGESPMVCDPGSCVLVSRQIDVTTPAFLAQDITDLLACKWACERQPGCTHVNWSEQKVTCELLACARTEVSPLLNPPSTAAQAVCHEYTNIVKHLRFTPLRTREKPIAVQLSNPTNDRMWFRLVCVLEDAKGARAMSRLVDYVEVLPEERLLPTSAADTRVAQWREDLIANTTSDPGSVSIHDLHYLLLKVQQDRTASPAPKLHFTEAVCGALSGRLFGGPVANMSVPRLQAHLALIALAAETANIAVRTTDTSANETRRDGINACLAGSLRHTVAQYAAVFYTDPALSLASHTVSMLLDTLHLKQELVDQTSDLLDSYARDADALLEIVSYIAKASLRKATAGTDSCAHCVPCKGQIRTHACRASAYQIRSVAVQPEQGFSFQFSTSGYVTGEVATRYDLADMVVLAAFTLPKNPKAYLGDGALLRGRVAYAALMLEAAGTTTAIAPVNNTAMNVTVMAFPTELSQVPLQVGMREAVSGPGLVKERWAAAPSCLPATVVSNVTSDAGGGIGVVAETCTRLRRGSATEFASVSTLMVSRCIPSDIAGCLTVENVDAPHENCRCRQCGTGHYSTPSPSGKHCVPYRSFSCADGEAGTTATLPQQCEGNAELKYGRCLCAPDMVCSGGVCEQRKVCGATGSDSQCQLSGLRHDPTSFRCACPEGQFCRVDGGDSLKSFCLNKSNCASLQKALAADECSGDSFFNRDLQACTCDRYSYCSTSGVCTPRLKCDEVPPIADASLCWPATVDQPQLLLLPDTTAASITYVCRCPSELQCNTTLQACTCPACAAGTCDYTDDVAAWGEIGHNCTCPEGRLGADCSAEEPRSVFFVEVVYPGGVYTSALAGAVAEIANAAVGETLGALQVSDVRHVYVESGSVVVRLEVHAFSSTWHGRAKERLQQQRFATAVAAPLRAIDPAAGGSGPPAITHYNDTCQKVAQCASTPRPWAACTCARCQAGYVLAADALACLPEASCGSIEHCSGRGVAVGLVATGCTCTCDSAFQGVQCETDLCLESLEAWVQEGCGPTRCADRIDGKTVVGGSLGSCASPKEEPVPVSAVGILIAFGVLAAAVSVCAIHYGFAQYCFFLCERKPPPKLDGDDTIVLTRRASKEDVEMMDRKDTDYLGEGAPRGLAETDDEDTQHATETLTRSVDGDHSEEEGTARSEQGSVASEDR